MVPHRRSSTIKGGKIVFAAQISSKVHQSERRMSELLRRAIQNKTANAYIIDISSMCESNSTGEVRSLICSKAKVECVYLLDPDRCRLGDVSTAQRQSPGQMDEPLPLH